MSKSIAQAALDDDLLSIEYDRELSSLIVQPEFVNWMLDAGYAVENLSQLNESVSLKPGDDNSAHLLFNVETMSKPTEDADAVEDQFSFLACSCPGFHYHRFPDLSEGEPITAVGECSHIEKWRKRRRDSRDDGQAALTEVQRGP